MRLQKTFVMVALAAAACGSPDASERAADAAGATTTGGEAVTPAPRDPAPADRRIDADVAPAEGGADDSEQAADGGAGPSGPSAERPARDSDTDESVSRGGAQADPAADGAPGADPDEILSRAERVYTGMRSMQADFVQRVTVPLLGQTVDSRGRIFHRRPDRFLMDFSEPEGDIIVADGRYLWMYYPSTDAKQVLRTTLAAAGGSVDLHREFLSDATRRFDAVHLGVEPVAGRSADVLRLTPRQASPYRQVTIWVDREDAMVRRFEIVEENESVRRLELRNLRPNVSLGDALFRFTPPPGAQVFDS